MRQKYIINKNDQTNEMQIQEYAVVDNDSYRKDKYLLTDADFVLLSEQNYAIGDIKAGIAKDRDDLVDTLRIREFFPARLCAEKIADSVVELFSQTEDQSIVLIYDDKDSFSQDAPEEKQAAAAKPGKAKA